MGSTDCMYYVGLVKTPEIVYTTSRIDVSNWRKSPKLIGPECKVKVRNWGQITDYVYWSGNHGNRKVLILACRIEYSVDQK